MNANKATALMRSDLDFHLRLSAFICGKFSAPVFQVQEAEDIIVAVIGGAGKHSAYIPTFGATRSVIRALKRRDGDYTRSITELKRDFKPR